MADGPLGPAAGRPPGGRPLPRALGSSSATLAEFLLAVAAVPGAHVEFVDGRILAHFRMARPAALPSMTRPAGRAAGAGSLPSVRTRRRREQRQRQQQRQQQQRQQSPPQPQPQQREQLHEASIELNLSASEAADDARICRAAAAERIAGLLRGAHTRKRMRADEQASSPRTECEIRRRG